MNATMDEPLNPSFNQALDRALLAYAELVALDPEDWSDRATIEELNQSRDLDASGLTTFMLLKDMLDVVLESTTFSARSVLDDPEAFALRVAEIRAVRTAVEHPEAQRLAAEFAQRLTALLAQVGAKPEAADALVSTPGTLALLRRDALRSLDTLKSHHFVRGERTHRSLALNATVFEFWNVNSLLSLLTLQDLGGVTLCLIRDPAQVMASFFVFAIRNGDDITLLSDREDVPHPAYWRMSRRPDRTLARRAERHHFPYHLLDLEPVFSDAGHQKGFRAADRTALVPLQSELAPLTTLAELAPDELAWVVMLHQQITERYAAGQPEQPGPLTYTGEMLRHPHALVGASTTLVRQGTYQPLVLAPLTTDQVRAAARDPQWEQAPLGHNEWMLDRYADRVPETVLNPIGQEDLDELHRAHPKLLGPSPASLSRFDRDKSIALESVLPAAFGTAAELERDRLWAARVNQCRLVQKEAAREFAATQQEVSAWYLARLKERLPFILEAVARGSLPLTSIRDVGFQRVIEPKRREALRVVVGVKSVGDFQRLHQHGKIRYGSALLGRVDETARLAYRCVVDDRTAASVFASITPDCTQGLTELLGLDVEELPIGLRHWHKDTAPFYSGNHILDRLDPSDWVLKNPWNKLRLSVFVTVSRRAYNAERRRLGLPHQPDTPVPESDD